MAQSMRSLLNPPCSFLGATVRWETSENVTAERFLDGIACSLMCSCSALAGRLLSLVFDAVPPAHSSMAEAEGLGGRGEARAQEETKRRGDR